MQVTVQVPERLVIEARERGVSVELYIQELLEQQTENASKVESRQAVSDAIARIRELRKGNKLDGLKIKDLIHEGHKY